MHLLNPLHSYIYEYINQINTFFNMNYNFKSKYNITYKENKDIISFICNDIISEYITENNTIIKEIKYDNYLEFKFNKLTNELIIYKVPTYIDSNIKIPHFTSDIANIIKECLSKYIDIKDIKIKFNDNYTPLVIDNNVKNIIPSITNTNNFYFTQNIVSNIKKELGYIEKINLSHKKHQDKIIEKEEKLYKIKRKIYGIDPINYNSINEFYEAVNAKIKYKVNNILKKIDKHLISTKKAYKNILWNQITNTYNYYNKTNYSIEELINIFKKNKNDCDNLINLFFDGYVDIADYDEILSSTNNNYEVIEKYIEEIFNYDLNNEDGLLDRINYIKKQYFNCLSHDEKKTFKNNLYSCYLYSFNNTHLIDFFNGKIRGSYDTFEKLDNNKIDSYLSNDSNIFKAIDLIWQYNVLQKDKEYYNNILNDFNKVTIDFDKTVKTYGEILNLPYWFIEGNFIFGDNPNKYDLLMIKPNCRNIDINKIVNFKKPKRYKGKRSKYNLNITDSPRYINTNVNKVYPTDRISITIPSTLGYEDIKKIVNLFYHHYESTYFICEDFTSSIIVKNLIINRYFNELKNSHQFNDKSDYEKYYSPYHKSKRSFVCIDPGYYNNYFKTTPTTNVFYHMYDCTSNYRFRRKTPLCIEDLVELYSNRDDKMNINKIKEYILGSYNSQDVKEIKDNKVDEIKYCAFAFILKSNLFMLNKREIENGKTNEIEENIQNIINKFDNIQFVKKDNNNYRILNTEEITKVMTQGLTNAEILLIKDNNYFIWKNFPYTPVNIEKIDILEKAKKLKKQVDFDIPF